MAILLPCLSLVLVSEIFIVYLLFACFAAHAQDGYLSFTFNRLDGTDLLLREGASIDSGAIKLTDYSMRTFGRALYAIPVQTNGHRSFSTTFVFCMVRSDPSVGGQGLAFMMTPYITLNGALPSQYLGLLNFTSDQKGYNHLFAVEFDTVQNPEFIDIDSNHVGVDLNSLESLESKTAGYWIGDRFQPLDLHSGQNIQAWIDYDHPKNQLNVTITLAGKHKPNRPLISKRSVNLSTIFQSEMYVGFSASTGTFVQEHYIRAWSFSTRGSAPPLDLSPGIAPPRLISPSFTRNKHIYRSARFVAGVAGGSLIVIFIFILAVFQWFRRMKSEELVEEWELEYWPHRFSYKELSIATKGFAEEELLGSGGFGKVYKGVIPSSGLQVAVKCIKREVTEGMSEFIAEISSMGRLQHRNLAQLRGWCRNDRQLLIVYDYMPNGSLDKMIFGSPKTVLPWTQRCRILKGVAAGLLYLHEQWEKRVVHRDIKSSNVLLDSELTAKLGDFGLARLYDHAQNPQTSRVVGTLGYIAPEIVNTGKATPGSDVFSFGVVLLEVACGRRPLEPSMGAEQVLLVDWIWDLYGQQKLMDAVDPKLGGEFDEEEMGRVLKLGLLCCQREPESRPTTRQVLQILEGEIPLPHLRMPAPSTSITITTSDSSSTS